MVLESLRLPTRDPDAATAFWNGCFDLPILVRDTDSVTFAAGETRLTFARSIDSDCGACHFAFNVPPRRFAEAVAWADAHATLIAGADGETVFQFADWDADACYFLDPDGHIAEFIARRTLDTPPDAPLGILGVSEIGLVVDDVAGAVGQIGDAGIAPYRTPGESFAPIGDERGLAIVVKRGRPWFPSTLAMVAATPPICATIRAPDRRLWRLDAADGRLSLTREVGC